MSWLQLSVCKTMVTKKNDDLRERFNINKDHFPVYKLWKTGNNNPVDYNGDASADDLTRFVSAETGIWIGLPGQIAEFNALVKDYVKLGKDKFAKKIQEAEALLKTLKEEEQDSGKFYLYVMKKIQEKGADFIKAEEERIHKLKKGKLDDKKKEFFARRLNILPTFSSQKDEL